MFQNTNGFSVSVCKKGGLFLFNGLLYQNVRLMAETNVNRWTGRTVISQTYSEAQWYECSTLEREIN